jgi:hypothetical protein
MLARSVDGYPFDFVQSEIGKFSMTTGAFPVFYEALTLTDLGGVAAE